MSSLDYALRETQTKFYALDVSEKKITDRFSVDDAFNLLKLTVKDADEDGALRYIVSTYDPYDMIIRDGYYPGKENHIVCEYSSARCVSSCGDT